MKTLVKDTANNSNSPTPTHHAQIIEYQAMHSVKNINECSSRGIILPDLSIGADCTLRVFVSGGSELTLIEVLRLPHVKGALKTSGLTLLEDNILSFVPFISKSYPDNIVSYRYDLVLNIHKEVKGMHKRTSYTINSSGNIVHKNTQYRPKKIDADIEFMYFEMDREFSESELLKIAYADEDNIIDRFECRTVYGDNGPECFTYRIYFLPNVGNMPD